VQITKEVAAIGGSQVYLDPREHFTVDELLYALMIQPQTTPRWRWPCTWRAPAKVSCA
jgi:hypothetical protein